MNGHGGAFLGACAYWTRRYLGGQLDIRLNAWLARSAPQEIVDGFVLVDFEQDGASEEYFAGLRAALRLIDYYDPPRYRRMQRYIARIDVTEDIPAGAMFMLGTKTCMIRPSLVKSGPATAAAALVHEATHARLDALRVRQSKDRYGRIETLCMSEEMAFVRHFPEAAELTAWLERRTAHATELRRGSESGQAVP